MMAIGIVGSLVGGVVSAMGAAQTANANAAAARQNAEIAKYNQAVAQRNKNAALAQADAQAADQERTNARQLASIRSGYGASGLALEGSPLAVMEDTALEQELDVQKGKYKGQLTALGYEDEAANYKLKETLYDNEAESASRAGGISVVGAIFSGITGAAKFGMGGGVTTGTSLLAA